MNVISKCLLTALAATISYTSLLAQEAETIERDVDVVNTYQPTLHRARKLKVSPMLDDTMTYKPKFNYVTLNRISSVTTPPDTLTAADMVFPNYESPYHALVQGAIGNSPNLFGQIFYNIENSKDYHLSLRAGHLAMLGKVKLQNDEKVKAPQNDSWANANFHKFLNKTRLELNFDFGNSAYRYYGLNNIVDSVTYLDERKQTIEGGKINSENKQRNTTIGVEVSLDNRKNVDPLKKVNYTANFALGFLGNKSGVHETNFNIGGAVRVPITSNSAIDGSLKVNHFTTAEGDNNRLYEYAKRNHTDIDVTPHYLMDNDFLRLQIGLDIIFDINPAKHDFIVHPDIYGDFFIGDGSVNVYAALKGEYCANSLKDILAQNRYVTPDLRYYSWLKRDSSFVAHRCDTMTSTKNPIVFELGVKAAFSKKVQMDIGMKYSSLGDNLFFVNRRFINANNAKDIARNSQFSFIYEDGKLFTVHASVSVSPTDNSNIMLSALYNNWKTNYIDEAWHKPTFETSLSGFFKPIDRLQVRAKLGYEGIREAYDPSLKKEVDLDGFIDLNIGAHYYISNRLTTFLDINNITAADQMRWLGYSTYRVNALAGITYKF